MSVDRSEIKLEIEVPGRPEEVWRAVATGPGISSWYVPHTVEEREGGAANASFGPGPEMQVAGRVAVWEPPRRVCFDGGEGVEGLAFEWSIEAIDDASCVVRLINTGFGQGDEWDAQYDAMTEGWRMFMFNLRLHLQHFSGQDGHLCATHGDVGRSDRNNLAGAHRRSRYSVGPGDRRADRGQIARCSRSRWHGRRHRRQSDRPVG